MTRKPVIAFLALALALAGSALLCGTVTAAPGGDGVLLIGDSLAVGGEVYLEQEMSDVPLTIDGEIGRASAAGLEALQANLGAEDGVVVFALGSNDDPGNPDALEANLEQANEIAGGRCVVVSTVSVEDYSGIEDAPLNRAIRSFAAGNPNVRVVEWQDLVTANPELLTDGAHATPEGYAIRASMIAQAIASCPEFSTAAAAPAGGDGIPNPDRDALAEGDSRPEFGRPEPKPEPEPIDRDEAFEILADAVSSQIAIGALQ